MGSCAETSRHFVSTNFCFKMKVFIVLALTLACVHGQFGFNPFRFFGGGRRPSRPAPPPRPFQSRPAQAPRAPSGGSRSCTNGFHVSSQHFSWSGATNYCNSNGMRASSLETQSKINTAYNLVRPLKYFWTGGSVNHGRRTVSWPNGATSTPDWSSTGGDRRPQPDNRVGNENCAAILNNFYGDGIKFHDVACHHTKPALCEC